MLEKPVLRPVAKKGVDQVARAIAVVSDILCRTLV